MNKKLIKKSEISNIVRKYNLNEVEAYEVEEYVDTLNREYKDTSDEAWQCSETHFVLFNSIGFRPEQSRRNAVVATVLYLAKRIQDAYREQNSLCSTIYNLEGISKELGEMLHVWYGDLRGFFIGLWTDRKFNQAVYTAHTFGQNYLELK